MGKSLKSVGGESKKKKSKIRQGFSLQRKNREKKGWGILLREIARDEKGGLERGRTLGTVYSRGGCENCREKTKKTKGGSDLNRERVSWKNDRTSTKSRYRSHTLHTSN